MRLLFIIFLTFTPFTIFPSIWAVQNDPLPEELLYDSKPIPNEILENFFGTIIIGFGTPNLTLALPKTLKNYETNSLQNTSPAPIDSYNPETIFEWKYVGTLYNKFLVIWAYSWEKGSHGKFTGLLILQREDDIFQIVDVIYGGSRHSSMIHENCRIEDNQIIFQQGATTGHLVDEALKQYPELSQTFAATNTRNICYGEAGYCGIFKKLAEITPEGKVKEIKILEFSCCEGCPKETELYNHGGIKALALDLLMD
jgi:hypothetical protein